MFSYFAVGLAVLLLSLIISQVVLRALRSQLVERVSELWTSIETLDRTEAAKLWKQRLAELERQREAAQFELEYAQHDFVNAPAVALMDSNVCLAQACKLQCRELELRELNKARDSLIGYLNNPERYKEEQIAQLKQAFERALSLHRLLNKLIAFS